MAFYVASNWHEQIYFHTMFNYHLGYVPNISTALPKYLFKLVTTSKKKDVLRKTKLRVRESRVNASIFDHNPQIYLAWALLWVAPSRSSCAKSHQTIPSMESCLGWQQTIQENVSHVRNGKPIAKADLNKRAKSFA